MKSRTRKILLAVGYCGTIAWIIPALIWSVQQTVEQQGVFSLLRTIRYGKDPAAVEKASQRLGKFELEGLIYVIQELKQEERRDQRIKVETALRRFLTGDCDKSRWGWGEKKALCQMLGAWPDTPGMKMREFDAEDIKEILMKKPGEIKPAERLEVLDFAIEYALVALNWKIEDSTDLIRNKTRRLMFQIFLDRVNAAQLEIRVLSKRPELELSGDQMMRSEDFVRDWLTKEDAQREKLLFSPEALLAGKLEAFLAGDPVAFETQECDRMLALLKEWREQADKLSPDKVPAVYASLKDKLRRFAEGAPVSFSAEDSKALCAKLDEFKDDYVGYGIQVKLKKEIEARYKRFAEKKLAAIDITPDERTVALKIARECRREYAYARVQMARTARQIVRSLTGKKQRFQVLVQDIDRSLGVFEQIKKEWKAKNDEIVILDLIDLLQDDDFGVRVNISDALAAIGDTAVYYLVEQMKKERVSSTAVVPTRDKTRDEREKELNAKNTQARREVAMILGRIGSAKAGRELELMTKDPAIGSTVHDALARLRLQQKRK